MKQLINACLVGMAVVGSAGLSACMAGESRPPSTHYSPVTTSSPEWIMCKNPRPEICYELYSPVCATRDTGIRCITTPCPAQRQITYANDCKACADSRVIGFRRGGACP